MVHARRRQARIHAQAPCAAQAQPSRVRALTETETCGPQPYNTKACRLQPYNMCVYID